jgi:hypothetical protein
VELRSLVAADVLFGRALAGSGRTSRARGFETYCAHLDRCRGGSDYFAPRALWRCLATGRPVPGPRFKVPPRAARRSRMPTRPQCDAASSWSVAKATATFGLCGRGPGGTVDIVDRRRTEAGVLHFDGEPLEMLGFDLVQARASERGDEDSCPVGRCPVRAGRVPERATPRHSRARQLVVPDDVESPNVSLGRPTSPSRSVGANKDLSHKTGMVGVLVAVRTGAPTRAHPRACSPAVVQPG